MKLGPIAATCLATLLAGGSSACHQAHNRFDIDIEGPWIVYQETNFNGHRVLILVAPDIGDDTDPTTFHNPQIDTGDGYFMDQIGIYCLTFDGSCAVKRAQYPLKSDGYTKTIAPLKVAYSNNRSDTWNWVPTGKNSTVMILPMPDSYSSDGVWGMHFSSSFFSGTPYSMVQGEVHSIGLVLHYDVPSHIDNFNLNQCATTASYPLTLTDCNHPAAVETHTRIQNSGTLHIHMKAPNDDNACDPHVRDAYPQMLLRVDSTATMGQNQRIKFIEPAWDTDGTATPQYEDSNNHVCFDKYDNQKIYWAPGSSHNNMASMHRSVETELLHLKQIVDTISAFDGLNKENKKYLAPLKDYLLLDQLKKASEDLDPNFPRLSQLDAIATLARMSASLAGEEETQLETEKQAKKNSVAHSTFKLPLGILTPVERKNVLDFLQGVETSLKDLADQAPAKGAKDCRAPVMEATNQQ